MSEARDCFTKCVNVTPQMALEVIKVRPWNQNIRKGLYHYKSLGKMANPLKCYSLRDDKETNKYMICWES